ncbi:MAG TPA: alpha/beta hydrolase [Ktedonobacterales bacterium]|nr:alpha/beta hydrolase [Ktedonobacterales bacterium]
MTITSGVHEQSSRATPADRRAALLAAEDALLRAVAPDSAIERGEVTTPEGVRLHYLTCGEGEPLLMLHGRGNAAALFAPLFAPLAVQRRVIALDLPGWGLSDKPLFTGHHAHDALDVWMGGALALLDALGLDQVDVLGHSMGGLTALGLALDHPARVSRLILVDSGGLGRTTPLDVRLFFWLKPERLFPLLGQRFMAWALAQDDARYRTLRDETFDFAWAVANQPDVIPSGGRAFDRWVNLTGVHFDLFDRLGDLEQPTLILWGERDRITPYADALKARRRITHGRLVAFTHCGHSPFAERPVDFARVVNVWLNGGDAPSRV